jgi:pimeloyl-ACP methyl ester carboxylesterase
MKIRGVELDIEDQGSGKPLIWGHGLNDSREAEDVNKFFDWSGLTDQIRLIRYDARGHGESEGTPDPADYTWANLGLDMIALADGLGLDRFIAGGASMGCATAIYAALAAPERIEALVLGVPPTAWETRTAQADFYERLANIVDQRGLDGLVAHMRQQPVLDTFYFREKPELIEQGFQRWATQNATMVPIRYRGARLSNLPQLEELKALTMPTLILAWADDPSHPVSTAETLKATLPNATLHIATSLAQVYERPEILHRFLTTNGKAAAG